MAADFEASGLVDLLAGSFRVIAFDRPGFGYSTRPRGRSWSAAEQARLIGDALQQLSVSGAIVVGHSWGTLVALELAFESPQRAAALMLLSGYYFPSPRMDAALAMPQAVTGLGDILNHTITPILARLAAPRLLKIIFAPSSVPARFTSGFPLDLALRPTQLQASARETVLLVPAAIATMSRRQALGVPVEVLAGAGDQIVNTVGQSQRLAEELNASLTVIPDVGHMIHYYGLAEIIAALRNLVPKRGKKRRG
jgi:pimeloyl-ACP methyl ester carboxylesterase